MQGTLYHHCVVHLGLGTSEESPGLALEFREECLKAQREELGTGLDEAGRGDPGPKTNKLGGSVCVPVTPPTNK
jgi:hypothetical protein